MLLNFTFQEASPLIDYSPGWLEGGDQSPDPQAQFYDGSFRPTMTPGAHATLNFVGSGIGLFGALRNNHGNYTIKLDQNATITYSGFSQHSEFKKALFVATGLNYGPHSITITNVPVSAKDTWLDLDFVNIERHIGQPSDHNFASTTLDDTSPSSVTYTPSGAWSAISAISAFQQTLHQTSVAQAQVTISFQGCCIELYGLYTNANYTVTLDNQDSVPYHGLNFDLTPRFQHSQTLLYLMDGLSEEGSHNITLTNSDADTNRTFYFDYAIVWSTKDFSPTNGGDGNTTAGPQQGNGSTPGTSGSTKTTSSVGPIVGGAVGGLLILVILVVAALFVIRRRRAAISTTNTSAEQRLDPYFVSDHMSRRKSEMDMQVLRSSPFPPDRKEPFRLPLLPSMASSGLPPPANHPPSVSASYTGTDDTETETETNRRSLSDISEHTEGFSRVTGESRPPTTAIPSSPTSDSFSRASLR